MFKHLLKSLQGAGGKPAVPAGDDAARLQEAQSLIAEGNGAEDAGRLQEALQSYRRAVALAPQLPAAHLNLGIAHEALGAADDARACYTQVLALAPGHPFGAYNLGKLDYLQQRLPSAENLLRAALAAKPDFPQAWVLLSNVLDGLRRLPEALEALDRALALQAGQPGPVFNRCDLLRRLGRLDEAQEAIAEAVRLAPRDADYLAAQSGVLGLQGFAAEALAPLRQAIAQDPQRTDLRSRELFLLNLVEGLSPDEIWARHRELGERVEAAVAERAHGAPRAHGARLRVGFVSGELRTHPVALFLLPVLERRDRARFEVFCYSSTERQDHVTERVRSLSDGWVDARGWTDAQLADAIAGDAIDLLVDLDGHTSTARLATYAARPAPVQLAWLGYLNTTGLTRMDYRLTDARCDPPAASQPRHTERLLFLPDSQWCYRPFVEEPCAPAAPCERNGYVTFGSLNSAAKLTPQMGLRWGRILQAVPQSRLVVADVDSRRKRQSLLDAIAQGGGAPERVRFLPRADLKAYYRCMDDIDIALDSHPYGGGTTTFDALWMGVPVLTAAGATPCSRSAASVLALLGLNEWIAPDLAGYEAAAIARAADPAALAQLRRTLRGRLQASPLMDEAAFVAGFQGALEQAWRDRVGARRGPAA